MTTAHSATRPLTSARKTLEVLDAIAEFRRPFRAPQVSARLGWSRATTYQQLVTLVTAGWLERGDDGDYRLSVRAARISSAAAAQAAPSERLDGILAELVARTREAASVALPDGDQARVLWRVVPDREVWASVPFAATLTQRSASARVLHAYRGGTAQHGQAGPEEAGLAAIRAAGFATYRSDDEDGVAAIAVPIWDGSGSCVAALALTGPSQRFDAAAMIEPISAAARQVSDLWQHIGNPAAPMAERGKQNEQRGTR